MEQGEIIKLIDFGMSKICKDENALMNTKLGTPYYVSPEVLDGKYDKRTDNWSIGVIAFFLLCGEPPFNGDTTAAIFNKSKHATTTLSRRSGKRSRRKPATSSRR